MMMQQPGCRYLRPFHAYQQGHLSWQAALEFEPMLEVKRLSGRRLLHISP